MGRLQKSEYKVAGGKLLRVQLSEKDGRIRQVKITGDFFLHPETFIENMEEDLAGQPLDEKKIATFLQSLLELRGAVLLGASPEDFARCIMMAAEKHG